MFFCLHPFLLINCIINDVMARYLISILMGIFALISCDKKEEPLTYEFTGTSMDTLIVGNLFVPLFYITSPPAKVSFYLEGPVKDFKGKVGDCLVDNTSDSLYIRDDMLFIQEVFSFKKNDYNKKYWKIPYEWTPEVSQVESNKIYCIIIQSVWATEGIPRTTWRNYIYMKKN